MYSLYIDGESVGNGPDTDKISDILNKLKIEMADMFCTDSAYDVCKVDDDMSLPKKSI